RAERLLLSRSLDKILDKVIKKEALSLFIPKEADSVPQVHDLSWVYAGVDDSIWKPLRRDPPGIFGNYDPTRLLRILDENSLKAVIREVLLLLRCSAVRGQLSFPIYFAMLRRAVGRELKMTEAERRIIELLSADPYAKTYRHQGEVGNQ
ncbi:MAG: hypothetical protein RMI85_02165, partial [Candidatus Korarchaeum sp.]|nr:hypothetical protein [Candidatus Korarchaeum sp.]